MQPKRRFFAIFADETKRAAMLYYCRQGYNDNGELVYTAVCPEIDAHSHFYVLGELGPKSQNVARFTARHLTKSQVAQIDDETAEYCALAERYTWAGLLVLAVEIENGVKNFWGPSPTFATEWRSRYISTHRRHAADNWHKGRPSLSWAFHAGAR